MATDMINFKQYVQLSLAINESEKTLGNGGVNEKFSNLCKSHQTHTFLSDPDLAKTINECDSLFVRVENQICNILGIENNSDNEISIPLSQIEKRDVLINELAQYIAYMTTLRMLNGQNENKFGKIIDEISRLATTPAKNNPAPLSQLTAILKPLCESNYNEALTAADNLTGKPVIIKSLIIALACTTLAATAVSIAFLCPPAAPLALGAAALFLGLALIALSFAAYKTYHLHKMHIASKEEKTSFFSFFCNPLMPLKKNINSLIAPSTA